MDEIIGRARLVVGDFPVLVKISAYDGHRNGMEISEVAIIARMLEEAVGNGCEDHLSCPRKTLPRTSNAQIDSVNGKLFYYLRRSTRRLYASNQRTQPSCTSPNVKKYLFVKSRMSNFITIEKYIGMYVDW